MRQSTASSLWKAAAHALPNGWTYTLANASGALSTLDYLTLLSHNRDFASWYTELLLSVPHPALFWEHPPLTAATIAEPAEFVVLHAPMLSGCQEDRRTFAEHIRNAQAAVIGFDSLGGDARLIAPCPKNPQTNHTHLSAFLRSAHDEQIDALWQTVALACIERLSAQPLWLSTSGLGVHWLHIRLDSRPKYYQHAPYKVLPDWA